MAHQFLFLCPSCHSEDPIEKNACTVCGARFQFHKHDIVVNDRCWDIPELFRWMRENLPLSREEKHIPFSADDFSECDPDHFIRMSGKASLRQGAEKLRFVSYKNIFFRSIEKPVPIREGFLAIGEESFIFFSSGGKIEFKYPELTCVTTNSHYFEFKVKGKTFFQIEFQNESPLKYEILFQKQLDTFYSARGKKIVEYQPHIRFETPTCTNSALAITAQNIMRQSLFERVVKQFLLWILRSLLRIFMRVKVERNGNLPANFPFVALLNHQSVFDPFIVLAFLDQRIAFLTKSTSFAHLIVRLALWLGRGIPTTRYQTDPKAIRHMRTFLERGIPLGIFPEGERTWNGELGEFKYSVVRLLVKFRIPVVPIIIFNSFSLMPRWAGFPRRQQIELTVAAPFCLVPKIFPCSELKLFLESRFREK